MTVQQNVESKLRAALGPRHLEVINESYKHNVPPGSESHFKLVVVSDAFESESRVRRHQMVNGILQEEIRGDIHALSMETFTAPEWEARGGRTTETPDCFGGEKASG